MKKIIEEMYKLSIDGEPFALATVSTRNGSAPRSAGAKMLVKQDGSIVGTVGGGILEAQVQQLANQVLHTHSAMVQEFEFNGKDAATMDAICGGRVEVLVEWVDTSDPLTKGIIQGMHTAIQHHKKAWLITTLPNGVHFTTHALIQPDGNVVGTLPTNLQLETVLSTRLSKQEQFGSQQAMIEPIDIDGTVYIFGAGHVSRSLAEFTKAVGFWTIVLDDREEYANRERFPDADEVIVLDSMADGLDRLQIDRDSFIVIVTRGHLDDRTVLAQVLKTDAGYIGMIGSRRKCNLIFEELLRTGFEEKDIQRVHAPIGLSISAETPEEIGISIVAEMIKIRAQIRDIKTLT